MVFSYLPGVVRLKEVYNVVYSFPFASGKNIKWHQIIQRFMYIVA
jgi:hypothetical protein